jgi:hypothetical protein
MARANQQELQQRVFATAGAVGWLSRQPDGRWTCRTKWKPDGDYELKVIRAVESGGHQWSMVGRADFERVSISTADATALQEGRLVFAFEKIAEQSAAEVTRQESLK